MCQKKVITLNDVTYVMLRSSGYEVTF